MATRRLYGRQARGCAADAAAVVRAEREGQETRRRKIARRGLGDAEPAGSGACAGGALFRPHEQLRRPRARGQHPLPDRREPGVRHRRARHHCGLPVDARPARAARCEPAQYRRHRHRHGPARLRRDGAVVPSEDDRVGHRPREHFRDARQCGDQRRAIGAWRRAAGARGGAGDQSPVDQAPCAL